MIGQSLAHYRIGARSPALGGMAAAMDRRMAVTLAEAGLQPLPFPSSPSGMLGGVSVRVHVPGPLLPYSGRARHLEVGAATVRAVLEELEKSHPALHRCICDETGAVRRHVNLFVNKSHVRNLAGLETPLSHGDEIAIIPAVSGG